MQWYNRNYTEITWFVIGLLTWAGLQDLSQGDYFGAMLSFGISYLNYYISKR